MLKCFITTLFAGLSLSGITLAAESVTLGRSAVSIPKGWREEKKEDERITLRSSDGREQATISIMHFGADASFSDFKRLCELRLEAERKPSEDIFVQSDGPFDQTGTYGMFYSGGEKKMNRVFSGYVTLKNKELITIYIESIGIAPKEHLETFKIFVSGLKTK
jgi:hypothetical protein